jgi:ubiquinone/menaquinone biosynthesis C-methylase UbiE
VGEGGDLPETHTAIAGQFSSVTCLDISQRALEIARTKLADTAEYVLGSLLDIPKPAHYFDAAYCAHVIYHVDGDLQERAIDELIRVIRPWRRVVIIYANPNSFLYRRHRQEKTQATHVVEAAALGHTAEHASTPPFYFAAHPLAWWKQFESRCRVTFVPEVCDVVRVGSRAVAD